MLRGGSFNNNRQNMRAAYRNNNHPNNRNNNIGFRVVSTAFCAAGSCCRHQNSASVTACAARPKAGAAGFRPRRRLFFGRAYIEAVGALFGILNWTGLAPAITFALAKRVGFKSIRLHYDDAGDVHAYEATRSRCDCQCLWYRWKPASCRPCASDNSE